jgi:hypothetical protein
MFYSILKAITNFNLGPNFTSAEYIQTLENSNNYIYITVFSFSSLYGISIYTDHVTIELLKVFDKNYIPKLEPIFKPEYLCVIYSLLKICRKELCNKLFSKTENKYDINFLKNNLHIMTHDKLCGNYTDIYLGIFALMNIPMEGGNINLGDKEVTLKYDDDNLVLMPFGIDWAYMGRSLWAYMCNIINNNKK